jgi:hypothetical protein
VSITHTVSGSLFNELRHNTQLGERWGYGASVEVDLEVEAMVLAATPVRRGFGWGYPMTGSRAAWLAVREYAADRAYMEQALVGDFEPALGRRLQVQADRIDARLGPEAQA